MSQNKSTNSSDSTQESSMKVARHHKTLSELTRLIQDREKLICELASENERLCYEAEEQ